MYQSPGCEIIHDFEDRIACCKNEQTAPNQTVPLLIVADQDINDKQDVFKYIVQCAIYRIHITIRGNRLIDKHNQQRENRQYQCRHFLSEGDKNHSRCHAAVLDERTGEIEYRRIIYEI